MTEIFAIVAPSRYYRPSSSIGPWFFSLSDIEQIIVSFVGFSIAVGLLSFVLMWAGKND